MEAKTMSITEKQEGLNQVVINKVQKMIEGKRLGVESAISRLLEEGEKAQDFIAPIGVNLKINDRQPIISFSANDHVLINYSLLKIGSFKPKPYAQSNTYPIFQADLWQPQAMQY